MRNFLKNNLAAFLMILFWASAYVGIRAGLKGYSPGALALFRYLVASVCMFFIYLRFYLPTAKLQLPKKMSWQAYVYVALLGILGFTIYNVALNYGEITVTAASASFIISQIPVLITIFAIFLFDERLTWQGWVGTSISFFGILLLSFGEGVHFHFDIGVIYILIAALAGSLYSTLQKFLLKKFHPIAFTTFAIWVGTLGLLIFLPQLISELPKAPLSATIAVIFIGIFPAAFGYLLWSYVMSQMPAAKAAGYLYVVPPVATIMGWLVLNEIPTLLAIIGGVIALCGAILVHRGVKKSS